MTKHLLVIAVAACFATAGIAQAVPTLNVPAQGHPTSSNAQLSVAQRGALVAQIVRTWGPFVQQVHQTSVGAWAGRMKSTFDVATDSNLQRAAGMKTFQGMMDALVGQHLSDAQVTDSLALQAQVLKSGVRPALLGSTAADLVYTPLAPCRIADTRNAGGPISGGFSRGFKGYSATNFATQGGIGTSNCGIPPNPSALMLNFTVVNATASGWLTVFPFGTTAPSAANLNYAPGQIVGNEIGAKMTIGNATDDFSVYAQGTTNVVIDVVGYFMAPVATPLENSQNNFSDSVGAGADGNFSHSCPAGYANAGGGCWAGNTGLSLIGNVALGGTQFCLFHNPTAAAISGLTYINCVRVPGR